MHQIVRKNQFNLLSQRSQMRESSEQPTPTTVRFMGESDDLSSYSRIFFLQGIIGIICGNKLSKIQC